MTGHLYAILSDIHANYEALLAVAQDAQAQGQAEGLPGPRFVCLGDIVDYGPQPNECMAWVMTHVAPEFLLRGNHDDDVSKPGWTQPSRVGEEFWPVTLWTRQVLALPHHETLRQLPEERQGQNSLGQFHLYHTWPAGSEIYINEEGAAQPALNALSARRYGLFGHTHQQVMFTVQPDHQHWYRDGWRVAMTQARPESAPKGFFRHQPTSPVNDWRPIPMHQALINPGSVGQPRQPNGEAADYRAQYLLLDTTTDRIRFQWRRVHYDVGATVRQYDHVQWPSESQAPSDAEEHPIVWGDHDPHPLVAADGVQLTPEKRAKLRAKLPDVVKQMRATLLAGWQRGYYA